MQTDSSFCPGLSATLCGDGGRGKTWLQCLLLDLPSFLKLGQVLKTEPGSAAAGGPDAGVTGKLKTAASSSFSPDFGVSGAWLHIKGLTLSVDVVGNMSRQCTWLSTMLRKALSFTSSLARPLDFCCLLKGARL